VRVRRFIASLAAFTFVPIAVPQVSAVVGGTPAGGNGAVVRLLMPDAVCSGALWTPRIVITAGHCITDMAGNVTNQPVQISLPGASVALSPQVIAQSATITVNGWRRVGQLSQGDDIAFLVLPMDLPGGTISRLATVAEVQTFMNERRVVSFLGYGRTTSTGGSATVPNVIDQPLFPNQPWNGSFSASQTSSSGICAGDSGGPVITQIGTEIVLIGVNSAASGPCARSFTPSMTGFIPTAFPDLVNRAASLAAMASLPPTSVSNTVAVGPTFARIRGTIPNVLPNLTATVAVGTAPENLGSITVANATVTTTTASTSIALDIDGLETDRTYYYRIAYGSVDGAASTLFPTGEILSFTPGSNTPLLTPGEAVEVASDSAVLTGLVSSVVPAEIFFQVSRTPDFAVINASGVFGQVQSTEPAAVSVPITGVLPNTTYFWRMGANGAWGTSLSDPRTFTTPVFNVNSTIAPRPLLTRLNVSLDGVARTDISPTAKSSRTCSVLSSKRLRFANAGNCRLKVTITRSNSRTIRFYNLAVVRPGATP